MYYGREYSLVRDGKQWLLKSGDVVLERFFRGHRLENLQKILAQAKSPEEADKKIKDYLRK